MATLRIAPSILSADFANLAQAARDVEGSADLLHVDVMDAHFVPNLTLGLPVVEALLRATSIPIDCHLMIDDPDRWAPPYAEAGAASVTFHAEAAASIAATAKSLRAAGARAGVAIKPGTPVSAIEDYLDSLDMLLVMTVEPGFGGQAFIEECVAKIREAKTIIERKGLQLWLQVDGGVNSETIERCAEAGADCFVAGSAVYGAADPAAAIRGLRDQAASCTH